MFVAHCMTRMMSNVFQLHFFEYCKTNSFTFCVLHVSVFVHESRRDGFCAAPV